MAMKRSDIGPRARIRSTRKVRLPGTEPAGNSPVDQPVKAKVTKQVAQPMNGWEREFSELLTLRQRAGEIDAWKYEAINLKLAGKTFYKPDFLVITTQGEIIFYEVKGFWEEDARVKVKTAAQLYPWFRFVAVTKRKKRDGGGWREEHFFAAEGLLGGESCTTTTTPNASTNESVPTSKGNTETGSGSPSPALF